MATQKYFNTLGGYLINFTDIILKDKELCKLLKYSDNRVPANCPDFDVEELIGKQIRLVPILPESDEQEGAFITILLDRFDTLISNDEFQVVSIRIDILVPNRDWLKVNGTLKPFAIMAHLDELFHGKRLGGVGTIKRDGASLITLSENMSGYSLMYRTHEFN